MSVDIPTMTQVDSLHCRPFNWRRRMFDKCPRQTKQTAHVRTTRPEAQTDGRVRNHDIFSLRIGKYSFNWKRYFRSGGNATRGLNIFFFQDLHFFTEKKFEKTAKGKRWKHLSCIIDVAVCAPAAAWLIRHPRDLISRMLRSGHSGIPFFFRLWKLGKKFRFLEKRSDRTELDEIEFRPELTWKFHFP